VAEDGVDNRRLLGFFLGKAGFEWEYAENGRVALEMALEAEQQGEPYPLILMDMQMPELDGYEATQRLRAAGYTGPVVALTAYALSGDRDRCIAAGCNAYLSKPIDRIALIRVVREYLEKD
jgi:CheY-like chemotaxis protein